MELFEERRKSADDGACSTVNDIARNYYKGKAEAYGEAYNEIRRLKLRITLPA